MSRDTLIFLLQANQCQNVSVWTNPSVAVSWSINRYVSNGTFINRGEIDKSNKSCQDTYNNLHTTVLVTKLFGLFSTAVQAILPTLQVSSGISNRSTKEIKLISSSSNLKFFSTDRVTLVDTKSEVVQWEEYKAAPFTSSCRKRCILERLGAHSNWIRTGGCCLRRNKPIIYSGINGGQVCNFPILEKKSSISIHLQVDNLTALSYLIKIEDNHNKHLLYINKTI